MSAHGGMGILASSSVYAWLCEHVCSYVCMGSPGVSVSVFSQEPFTLIVFLTGEWGLPIKPDQLATEL